MTLVFFIIQVRLIKIANTQLDRSAALVLSVKSEWTVAALAFTKSGFKYMAGARHGQSFKNGRILDLPEPEPKSVTSP